jgi:hypothetical protein
MQIASCLGQVKPAFNSLEPLVEVIHAVLKAH